MILPHFEKNCNRFQKCVARPSRVDAASGTNPAPRTTVWWHVATCRVPRSRLPRPRLLVILPSFIPMASVPVAAIPWRTFPTIPIGPVDLHTFGLFVAAGMLLGAVVLHHVLRDSTIDLDDLDRVLLRSVVAGLVGARVAWVVTHLSELDGPLDALAVWDGGLQFSGGFLVAVAAGAPWLRRQTREHRMQVGDAVAMGLAPGLAVGRLGCIAVGEHLGGPTDFLLGTRYLGGPVIEGPLTVGVTYHNTSVYELLHLAVLSALLAVALRAGWLRVGDGRATAAFLGWYAVWRFVTDLTRSADEALLSLTGAQWVSVLVLLPGAVLVLREARRGGASMAPDELRR